MAKKNGDHFAVIKLSLTRDEPAMGTYIFDKLVFVNPGETKTFKILIPAGEISTVVNFYNKAKEKVGEVTVTLPKGE